MLRVFIDSSVLFAAAYSSKGYARDLILMAARDEIRLVISTLVVAETRRNLADFAPEVIPALELIFAAIDMDIVDPSREEVIAASTVVAFKDAPILAAAKVAQADFLITLDKKHLLDRSELESYANLPILRPADAYQRISGLTDKS
jgi:predicted nucleic acid-binding protein